MRAPLDGNGDPVLDLRRMQPSRALAEFVRYYVYCDFLPANDAPHPVTVSLFPVLNFFLAAPCRAFEYASSTLRRLPPAVVIGPCDRRVADVFPDGRYRSLTAVFQPTGFYRLFHTSPREIRNFAYDASDVLGAEVALMHERLHAQPTPEAAAQTLDDALKARLVTALPATPLQNTAKTLLDPKGENRLPMLALSAGLSERSWRRVFQEQIGVGPKRFARMLRFRRAMTLKLRAPERPWTGIGIEAGYYDQAHLIAEFREFSDSIPSGFARELARLPQAVVGNFFSDNDDGVASL